MDYSDLKSLRVVVKDRVAFVTIDHPPINLFDIDLIKQINELSNRMKVDDEVRVLVLRSANPDFFIAHADVEMIRAQPVASEEVSQTPNGFQRMTEKFRLLPQVTIGQIEGRAGGGGSELLLSLDMRFASIGRTVLSQPEVALGILPGGGGTQRLPRLVGRSRAMEIILGCQDFDAELAEKYGYVNRAVPADKLETFVDELAYRIAQFSPKAVAHAKASVNAADVGLTDALALERHHFDKTVVSDEAQRLLLRFLEIGGQTREGELDLANLVRQL